MPDRIEAGTYLIAGALMGDDVRITECRPSHLGALTDILGRIGVSLVIGEDSLGVRASVDELDGVEVETAPYPRFPTDMQAQLMALLTQARGASCLSETIFENRFMHVSELARMGARIELRGNQAIVHGPTPLAGTTVMATDLRASACLVLAGLCAEGKTLIDRVYHLDRGYEHIEEKMAGLGAEVERIA